MSQHTAFLAFLALCMLSLFVAHPAAAQPSGGGLLRERIQDRVQGEIDKRAAQTRAEIEQQMAARPSPAEIAQVRQIQTALTYFSFDAGPVDGIMGQQTRGAIQDIQAFLDYPVTGTLTESEAQFLVVSYQQAQANSAQVEQIAATHPDGIKGVLLVFRDGAAPQPTGVMPSFRTAGDSQSTSAFCTQPASATASDTFMDQTLRPLFCSAAEAAIAQSDALAATAVGFTPAQIDAQCLGFAPALVSLVASVSEDPASDVVQGAADFVQRTGQDPQQMSGIARVCLGVGYRLDQLDLAIGSAVLLTALDAPAYAEYVGYHLALGIGIDRNPMLARAWFERVIRNNAEPQSDFEAQAAARLDGLQSALMQSGAQGATGAVQLPAFSVTK